MQKIVSTNIKFLLIVGAIILAIPFAIKYVLVFIGTVVICVIGFLVFELLG